VEVVPVSMAEAVSMVVDAGRLHHQLELSRPTAFAVGRGVLEA
jgi:thiazole synthase ThiGH ThiG subunit